MTYAALSIPTDRFQWTLKVLSTWARYTTGFRRRSRSAKRSNIVDPERSRPLVSRFEEFERYVLVTKQSAEALQSSLTTGINR